MPVPNSIRQHARHVPKEHSNPANPSHLLRIQLQCYLGPTTQPSSEAAFRLHINCGLKAFILVEADEEAIRRTGPALAIPNIEAKWLFREGSGTHPLSDVLSCLNDTSLLNVSSKTVVLSDWINRIRWMSKLPCGVLESGSGSKGWLRIYRCSHFNSRFL